MRPEKRGEIMGINNFTKVLSDEHQHILGLAELLDKECSNLENKKELRKEFFASAIKFIKNYADKFHHGKEEDILFTELTKDNNMHCNPIPQMLFEHDEGRRCVKEMELGLRQDNKDKLISGGRGYAQLIREHIHKEDNILYPMAEEALGEKEKEKMLKQFAEADKKNESLRKEGLKLLEGLRSASPK